MVAQPALEPRGWDELSWGSSFRRDSSTTTLVAMSWLSIPPLPFQSTNRTCAFFRQL